MKIFLYVYLCLLFFCDLVANETSSLNQIQCKTSYTLTYSDSTDLNKILQLPFQTLPNNSFSLGSHNGDLWILIECTNLSKNSNYILTINESFYEIARLYTQLENQKWSIKNNGLYLPIKQRDVQSKLLSFHLNIEQNKTNRYYLQLNGKLNYLGEIKIFPREQYSLYELLESNFFELIVIGIFFTIILFNLFFYYILREKIYLYYLLYATSTLFYFSISSGILSYFNLQNYIHTLLGVAPLSFGFFLLFSREILDTKLQFKKIYTFINLLVILFFCLTVGVIYQFNSFIKIVNLTVFLSTIFLLIFSLYIYKTQCKEMKLYSLALLIFFTSLIISILFGSGIIEYNFWTRHSIFIGALIETIVFQFLIAKRFQESKEQELLIKKDLISLQNKINLDLQMKVNEKTQELKDLLLDRELLLREVHHRVKNNFHSLIALLWIDDEKNNTDRNSEIINHLKALSSIHEQLCSFKNFDHIDLKQYLIQIINNLRIAYSDSIKITHNISDIDLEFESAMALGVIVNEAVTNSIKHSKKRDTLSIQIELIQVEKSFILEIIDNNFNPIENNSNGFGIGLIKQFASMLPNSSYHFKNHQFYLEFFNE